MPNPRYEQLPTHDDTTDTNVIILSPINQSYNSGLPTSAAPSIRSIPFSDTTSLPRYAPTPSTTNSSPPSYVSTEDAAPSRSDTPRPTPSTYSTYGHSLCDVAPSTLTMSTSQCPTCCAAAQVTIVALETRMQRMEESLGQFLLQSSNASTLLSPTAEPGSARGRKKQLRRNNCCTTYDLASPELEEAIISSGAGGDNCCVRYRRRDRDRKGLEAWGPEAWGLERRDRRKLVLLAALTGMLGFWGIVAMVVVLGASKDRARVSTNV